MPPSQACTRCTSSCAHYTPNTPTQATTCEVYLVRHGETEWNRALRLQGRTDIELNEKGCKQGVATAKRMIRVAQDANLCSFDEGSYFAAIYSSPLKRAKQTADIVAEALGIPVDEVVVNEGLLEWNLGVLEGKTGHHCQEELPRDWASWSQREKRGTERVTGGESGDEVVARVSETINQIASKHQGQRVIVVCHGGMLSQIKRCCLTPPNHVSKQLDLEYVTSTGNKNASLSVVHVDTQTCLWELTMWSDVEHLYREGLVGESAY